MGFKDFMYTEKGKITGSVLAAVLITTAVMVPVSIFADRAINGGDETNSVQVWGYDDQVSSTAKKINYYMDADFTSTTGLYGGMASSAEPALLNNEAYHSVQDDIDILDGVAGADNALGYLSTTWIKGYSDTPLRILKTYQIGTKGEDLYNTVRNDEANYLDPTDDADKATYIEMDSDYAYESEMASTLNMHLKVSSDVADSLRTDGLIGLGNTGAASWSNTDFGDWLTNKGYADDFVLALAFFNYAAYDTSNHAIVNAATLQGTTTTDIEFSSDDVAFYDSLYKAITGDSNSWIDVMTDQQSGNSGLYSIKVDGTGTDSGVMNMEINNFEKDFNEAASSTFDFEYNFVNGGSGEGWKTPSTKIPGVSSTTDNSDAREDSFIGTQSRFSKESEIDTNKDGEKTWGYDYSKYESEAKDGTTYKDPATSTSVIGYTMGIDLPVFFVKNDMKFDYTIANEQALATITNPTAGLKVGDTVTLTVTGMSDLAAKNIYQNGQSWQNVIDAGLVLTEIV